MTSPNDPGRDDAEMRDGQDSATSNEEKAQAQSAEETPEQAESAEATSAEKAEDTKAEAAAKPEAASEAAAEETKAEEKPAAASAAEGEHPEITPEDHASGLGEELAQDVEKKRTGLVIGIAAAVVLVLAAAGVGAYFLFSGPSPQSVADGYTTVSNKETQDPASVTVDDYKPYVCSKAMPQIQAIQQQKEAFLKQAKPQDLQMLKQVHTSVKNVTQTGDTGKVVLEQTVPGQGAQQLNLNLIKEDGWKLCA